MDHAYSLVGDNKNCYHACCLEYLKIYKMLCWRYLHFHVLLYCYKCMYISFQPLFCTFHENKSLAIVSILLLQMHHQFTSFG